MVVSLYTSRVVLQALGVVDYGIYGVVGGIVAMFGFINTSMSGATARFITYELGRGNKKRLQLTFNMAFYEHLIIAGLLFLICEIFGLWFLNNQLVIPAERMVAANWVFQMSILAMLLNVTQVPYSASIVAHENMSIYAYVEMVHVILKLLIVYLLSLFMFDRLIFYAVLIFILSYGIRFFYWYYCRRHFEECRLRFCWDSSLLKSMLSFSGWDLYGNMSVMARTQGVNMLLNIFFGPAMNAASSIATNVQSAVLKFASNVSTAVKPQIIKYYAQGNYREMVHLMSNAVRLNYLILMFVTIPLLVELPYVLRLWLGIVPDFTVSFCALTLIFNFYGNMSQTLVTGIHATGKIIRPSLINGSLYLMVVPLTYFAFRQGLSPWSPYVFNVVAVLFGMLSNAYTMHLYVREFSLRKFLVSDFLPCILVFVVSIACCFFFSSLFHEGFGRLVGTTLLSFCILSLMGYYFLIPKSISYQIVCKMRNAICRKD